MKFVEKRNKDGTASSLINLHSADPKFTDNKYSDDDSSGKFSSRSIIMACVEDEDDAEAGRGIRNLSDVPTIGTYSDYNQDSITFSKQKRAVYSAKTRDSVDEFLDAGAPVDFLESDEPIIEKYKAQRTRCRFIQITVFLCIVTAALIAGAIHLVRRRDSSLDIELEEIDAPSSEDLISEDAQAKDNVEIDDEFYIDGDDDDDEDDDDDDEEDDDDWTIFPTELPTSQPTLSFCEDNPAFRHDGFVDKDCRWVATQSKEECQNPMILLNCPATCSPKCGHHPSNLHGCDDNPSYRHEGDGFKSCEWVTSKPTERCALALVTENCRATCAPECGDNGTPWGVANAIPAPSEAQVDHSAPGGSHAMEATIRPEKVDPKPTAGSQETVCPDCDINYGEAPNIIEPGPPVGSEENDCVDDPDFRYEDIDFKDCAWVAKAKTELRCSRNRVAMHCRRTCHPECEGSSGVAPRIVDPKDKGTTEFPTEAPTVDPDEPTSLPTSVPTDPVDTPTPTEMPTDTV